MNTTLTVITPVESNDTERAIAAGRNAIMGSPANEDFYAGLTPSEVEVDGETVGPVVMLASDNGEALVDVRIEQTVEEKADLISEIVTAAEQDSPADAAQSYDVMRTARELGNWRSTSAYLYDGTGWSRGQPVLTDMRVDTIQSEYSGEWDLGLVNFTAHL